MHVIPHLFINPYFFQGDKGKATPKKSKPDRLIFGACLIDNFSICCISTLWRSPQLVTIIHAISASTSGKLKINY